MRIGVSNSLTGSAARGRGVKLLTPGVSEQLIAKAIIGYTIACTNLIKPKSRYRPCGAMRELLYVSMSS